MSGETRQKTRKSWMGSDPKCDFCGKEGKDDLPVFVDGKTQMGPWAMMCPTHHRQHGLGLGTGRGQEYTREDDGVYYKTAG